MSQAQPNVDLALAVTNAARAWLSAEPDAATLATHVAALELVWTAQRETQDAALWSALASAMTRVNDAPDAARVALQDAAALLDLNIQLWQFTQAEAYRAAARRWTDLALARFDAVRGLFPANASAEANVFYVDVNARMAEALYHAWRALDEPQARSIAGELLGQVSDAFVVGKGLYQRFEMPDGARSETRHLAAYTNALQMFLTAMETTGRGAYLSRASILADFVLAQEWASAAGLDFAERAQLAAALTRLFKFTKTSAYATATRALLSQTADVPSSVAAAAFALALKSWRAMA